MRWGDAPGRNVPDPVTPSSTNPNCGARRATTAATLLPEPADAEPVGPPWPPTSPRELAARETPAMRLNLSADEVLTTTRSVRKRLDFEKPVEREVVMECLDIALQAPTGSNRQGWQWVFVDDPDKKQALRDIYLPNFMSYAQLPKPRYGDDDPRAERFDAVAGSATYLAENFHRAPILMIPLIEGRVDNSVDGMGASFWGSLLPAVWSFMLALRERGIGSAWTTLHLVNGGERRAADLLGIPYDKYSQAGLFPIAYTQGTDFKQASRLPAAELTHWNEW